jgi:hypothetical protein
MSGVSCDKWRTGEKAIDTPFLRPYNGITRSKDIDEEVEMEAVFRFIAGPAGRVIRAVAGLALILVGLLLVKGSGGWIMAIVGLAPLLAGILDFCIFAPLFSLPFMGPRLRDRVE